MRSDVADATSNVAYDIFDTNMWGGGGGPGPGPLFFWGGGGGGGGGETVP